MQEVLEQAIERLKLCDRMLREKPDEDQFVKEEMHYAIGLLEGVLSHTIQATKGSHKDITDLVNQLEKGTIYKEGK